jgi:hypothetical protein
MTNVAGCAYGNATLGLVCFGYGRVTNLYTHATGVFAAATTLPSNMTNGTAGGNETLALISHGGAALTTAVRTRTKFTFATKLYTTGTQGTIANWAGSAFYGGVTGVNL